jgi:hypothetical protein
MKELYRVIIASSVYISHLLGLILVFLLGTINNRVEQIYYELAGGIVLGGNNFIFYVLIYFFGVTFASFLYLASIFFKIEQKKM